MAGYTVYGTAESADMGQWINVTDATRWGSTAFGSPVTSVRAGGPGWDTIATNLGTANSCAPAAEGVSVTSGLQGWKQVCPDNQLVTGCDNSWSKAWSTATIGTCTPVPVPGTTITNAIWNRSLSSGKTFQVFRGISCSGTAKSYGNGAKEAFAVGSGWEGTAIRAYKRTA
jgi:hypothetical protein